MASHSDNRSLLERDDELVVISDLIASTRGGDGHTLMIEGAAGIGKTSLLRLARDEASHAGLRACAARASELEHGFAFGVVRQLLEPALSARRNGEDAVFSGAARLAANLFEPNGDEPAARDLSALLHGLFWLCSNLADHGPLMLAVDDAHWADSESLRFLTYLARRLDDLPVAVLLTMRPGEAEVRPELLAELCSEPSVAVIRPRPLSMSAVSRLIDARLGAAPDGEFARACHETVAGNPFFLELLIETVADEELEPVESASARVRELGPRTVSRFLLTRFAKLPPAATDLARAVAVLGDGGRLRDAAELAVIERDEARVAADALSRAAILRRTEDLAFVHPIVRSTVYLDLSPHERSEQHARAAAILESQDRDPEVVAAQLLKTEAAGDPARAEMLRQAGHAAIARGAADAAARYLRRALDEQPEGTLRADILRDLGIATSRAGSPDAADWLREAFEVASTPALRTEIGVELARVLMRSDRVANGVELLLRMHDEMRDEDGELALELRIELMLAARVDLAARELVPDALRVPDPDRLGGAIPAERRMLAVSAIDAALSNAPADEAAALALRAAPVDWVPAEVSSDSPLLYFVADTLSITERVDEAARLFSAALHDAGARGSIAGFAQASCFRSSLWYRIGALADAEADARAALGAAEQGWAIGRPYCLAFLIDALVERGDLDGARACLEQTGIEQELGESSHVYMVFLSRGRLRLAEGALEEAVADLDESGRRQAARGIRCPAFYPWRSLAAEALARLGENAEARRLADEELGLAHTFGAPRAIGIALRAAALANAGEDRVAMLEDSVRVLEQSRAQLELARSLVDWGGTLRRAGRRQDARDPLRRALDLGQRCGAHALVERAREELAATGARPRRELLTGADSLTASERRIARLAVDGMSNREIAQALFVTKKTVEMHLSHAYRKLDISSRTELSGALEAQRERVTP